MLLCHADFPTLHLNDARAYALFRASSMMAMGSRDGLSRIVLTVATSLLLLSSGVKALLVASPSSPTAAQLFWGRNGGRGSFVAPVASKALAANRRGGVGAGASVANGWSAAAAGSGSKEVGSERRGHSLRMVTRLEIVSDADIPETAEFFVENFWDDAVAPSQKRSLVRELVSDYRRRYGTLMGNRKLQSMLMVARGNRGEIIGCIAVEVSVCMGERVGVKARGISPNAEGAELRPILANLAVARSERRKGLAKRLVKHCEHVCREWGYDEVLLLVEENNKRARRLYSKLGYKMLFRDTEAKKILPDSYQIRDVPCVNVCMRRDLNANIFSNLFAMIRQ